MDADQIKTIVSKDPHMSKLLAGIISAKDVKKIAVTGPPKAFIVNTGNHWVLIINYGKHRVLVYYDSYGEKPPKSIENWLKQMGNKTEMNRVQQQPDDSSYCGLYVIFVLYYVSRGITFQKVMKLFHKRNLSLNDRRVAKFVVEKFGFDVSEIKL